MPNPHGVINHSPLSRKNDFLYRISIKALIENLEGKILVVKESGRTWWDLPGGGMDHGEDIKAAITRELAEEVSLEGGFTYRPVDVDDPTYLPSANVLQVRLIFEVIPEQFPTKIGTDADEIEYMDPLIFKDSTNPVEQRIYCYCQKAKNNTPS